MKIKLLDHGYVSLVEAWGSDERIIEAARMSTDKGFQGWGPINLGSCPDCKTKSVSEGSGPNSIHTTPMPEGAWCQDRILWKKGDEKLLGFLWENKHATPFEMAGMVIEVQAPIFVFREWHRHRTQSYNELSARYTALPDLFYVPGPARIMAGKQAIKNKQGSEEGFLLSEALSIEEGFHVAYKEARERYERLLEIGVARELARLVIPVAQYSRMRASANLRNWLAFLTLRMAPNAQWEIRQYANAVSQLIEKQFPRTHELFKEGIEKGGKK